jgi:hypothetical protein
MNQMEIEGQETSGEIIQRVLRVERGMRGTGIWEDNCRIKTQQDFGVQYDFCDSVKGRKQRSL